MPTLPETVVKALDTREGPAIVTTVDSHGKPNSVYVGGLTLKDNTGLIVTDNFFNKTRQNICEHRCKGAILFITADQKSYQVKGSFEYHTDGPIYREMKSSTPESLPGVAAVVLVAEEAWSGSEKLM